MKLLPNARLIAILLVCTTVFHAKAQYNTVQYVSHGYFTDLNLADSVMIKSSMVITISQNKVEILKIDIDDASKDEMFFESRTLSALKYPGSDGEDYYVWKLGDRKMILRKQKGTRYLSLYQTDEYGLPAQYLTFKLKD